MAYNLMKTLVKNKLKTKAQLTKMANVYFAAGQLNEDEYMEIMALIEVME